MYNVYGVGNALVDIQARIPDGVLQELGFEKGAMTLVGEDDQSRVLSGLEGVSVNQCAGGSAANTIVGIAQMGGKTAYAGKTGADSIGDFFLRDMRDQQVRIEVPQIDGSTGTSVILITEDAERTMLTHLGLSSTLSPADIEEEEIAKAKYVYLEGYLYTGQETTAAAERAIELAKKHGVKVAFTASDPFVVGLNRDRFISMIEGPVDLFFCNLDEARSLTGEQDPIDCAHWIHQHSENVALTMGPAGSILMHEGEAIPIEAVSTKALDTTGAGDMYAAGILYGITNGWTYPQAGRLASHASARVVSQLGARLADGFTEVELNSFRV